MVVSKRAQFITEYLLVIGIALVIIVAFTLYITLYYISYSNASNSNQIYTAADSIIQEANYISSEGVGSKISFPVNFPVLSASSSLFCGSSFKITSDGYSSITEANAEIEGVLPLNAGNSVLYARYNGSNLVQIGVDRPVAFITYNYAISGKYLIYNISFYNLSYYPAKNTGFNISVLYQNGTSINSTVGSAVSGKVNGEIYVKALPIPVIIDIFVPQYSLVSPSCFPIGITALTNMTINNSQSLATISPFQQMVNLSSSFYSSYANSALSNVEFFYGNGTIIPSWLENYSASNAIWWLKLLHGIGASSSITIYIGFASTSTDLFNTNNIGENPLLSPVYGEYDDGPNVFTFYDNFAGTHLSYKWGDNTITLTKSGGTLIINNSMSFERGSQGNAIPFLKSQTTAFIPSSGVIEAYGTIPAGASGSSYCYAGFGITKAANINANASVVGTFCGTYGLLTGSIVSQNKVAGLTGGKFLWQIFIPSTTPSIIYASQNYGPKISSSLDMPKLPQVITFFDQNGTNINLGPFYWVRTRAYPPNGVMPTVTVV